LVLRAQDLLINMIAGLLLPSGTIQSRRRSTMSRRRACPAHPRIGYVFQTPVVSAFDVRQNLDYGGDEQPRRRSGSARRHHLLRIGHLLTASGKLSVATPALALGRGLCRSRLCAR